MLDFIGMVITAALMVLVVNALTTFMDVSRVAKVTLAAVIGVWIGLAAAAAEAGWLTISRPVPVVGLFVVVPLLAAALATAWPAACNAMLSIPMSVMVALNIVRVFAVLFLVLAAEGRLTGPFPYSAAWGDIITGVAAVPVLWLLKDGGARSTPAIAAWNLFGAADLVLAIGFGVTSAEGSPLQLFPGPGSEAMQHAPWSFVPTVLVPIWLILHAIIAMQLRRAKVGQAASVVA
ncbi:MAG: hypothetical protein ABWY92_06840 [Xanthobacteraceae bacterium]|jgi:hypothetical protein